MLIVKDEDVEVSLAYLNEDPHPIALARKDVTIIENKIEALFADLYPSTQGSVTERKCEIERAQKYRDLKMELAEAECELERHKARVRISEVFIDVWRTEQSNARAAERVR